MQGFVALLISGYIGICEARAPQPWTSCEKRWTLAMGWLVPSPVEAASRWLVPTRRREETMEPPSQS
jgi:hypothetical protein